MANNLLVKTSAYGVVRLLLCNEMDLTENWSVAQSQSVLNTLLSLSIDEILAIVDSVENEYLATDDIPQFGSIENLIRVPFLLAETGTTSMNYGELGLLLKNDPSAKLDANIKFGENHGKGASLLGLVDCIERRFYLSSLSNGFCQIRDQAKQREVVLRLFFRIPIVQAILFAAKKGVVNGYDFMEELTESTKKRRGQCLRAIFRDLQEFNNIELNKRIRNIIWD